MAIIVVVGLVAVVFGLLPAFIALVIAAPFLWRLEHHFFFGRRDADDELPSNEKDNA